MKRSVEQSALLFCFWGRYRRAKPGTVTVGWAGPRKALRAHAEAGIMLAVFGLHGMRFDCASEAFR